MILFLDIHFGNLNLKNQHGKYKVIIIIIIIMWGVNKLKREICTLYERKLEGKTIIFFKFLKGQNYIQSHSMHNCFFFFWEKISEIFYSKNYQISINKINVWRNTLSKIKANKKTLLSYLKHLLLHCLTHQLWRELTWDKSVFNLIRWPNEYNTYTIEF